MSKKRQDDDDDGGGGVTEITEAEFSKVAGVRAPANRTPFVILKSQASDPNVAYMPLVPDRPAAARKSERYLQVPNPKPDDTLALPGKKVKSKSKFEENAGRKLSPKAKAAFAMNAEAVREGKRPGGGKAKAKLKVKKTRRLGAWPVAAKAALSGEIPATGVLNEAASIQAVVTGESAGLCAARTQGGTPCRRPAVRGGKCHLHG